MIMSMNSRRGWIYKIYHYLFKCPTFWRIKPAFKCPLCGSTYRCYWDGHDIAGQGIDICNNCANRLDEILIAEVGGNINGIR